MTVEEILEEKEIARKKINDAVIDFNEKTTLSIDAVIINSADLREGKNAVISIELIVKL